MTTQRRLSTVYWKRLGIALAAALVMVPAILTLGLADVYARAYSNPPCTDTWVTPGDLGLSYEEITVSARDGLRVAGWYVPPRNGVTIIAAPGFNGNRSHALPDFDFLALEGYGLLVFEQRHCSLTGVAQTLGYNEAQDVLGAVDWLLADAATMRIGAIGFSAGGASVVLAAAQEPAIEAVVDAGSYHNLEMDITDPHKDLGAYDRLMRRLIVMSFRRQTGVHPRQSSPVDVIVDIAPRPILLIYGEHEPTNGNILYEAASAPRDLWIVPGAGHGGYRLVAPGEYERRVVSFFDQHLVPTDGDPRPDRQ